MLKFVPLHATANARDVKQNARSQTFAVMSGGASDGFREIKKLNLEWVTSDVRFCSDSKSATLCFSLQEDEKDGDVFGTGTQIELQNH